MVAKFESCRTDGHPKLGLKAAAEEPARCREPGHVDVRPAGPAPPASRRVHRRARERHRLLLHDTDVGVRGGVGDLGRA